MNKLIAAAVMALVSLAGLTAQPADRVLLGEMEVNFRADHDTLVVGLDEGTFRRIVIEAEGNDIQVLDLDVVFGNGTRQDVPVRHIFREDSRSRIVDLRGAARIIRSIKVTYRTVGRLREGRATLKFYGIP